MLLSLYNRNANKFTEVVELYIHHINEYLGTKMMDCGTKFHFSVQLVENGATLPLLVLEKGTQCIQFGNIPFFSKASGKWSHSSLLVLEKGT